MSAGFIDVIANSKASGWAVGALGEAVVVELLIDGVQVGEAHANELRESLVFAGYGDGRHGWTIDIPEPFQDPNPSRVSARVKDDGTILTNNAERVWRKHLHGFSNSTIDGYPKVDCDFTFREPDADDLGVAQEIITLYGRVPPYRSEPGSIWDLKSQLGDSTLGRMIEQRDPKQLATFLVSLPTKEEAAGFLQGQSFYDNMHARDPDRWGERQGPTKDALVSLAQYLGVERVESCEVGPFGAALHLDQEHLARRIEERLGIDLVSVVFSGLFGLRRHGGGVVSLRDIQAVYAAYSFLSIAGKGHLCEIGGGAGKAAYFAARLGCARYTLIDLPMMCIYQYFYLRRALHDKTISIITTPSQAQADISIVPSSVFQDLEPVWCWDGILNVDSFPEMGETVCRSYFDFLVGRSALFLSINQEGNCPLTPDVNGPRQPVVLDMLTSHPAYHLVSRHRTWVRSGFTDEVYRIASPSSSTR